MVALLFAVSGQSARAASGDIESITMSPVSEHYKLSAGDTKSGELTIINDGKTDYNFIVYSRPYSVQNANYDPDFVDTKPNTDAYQWVQFPKVSYFLKAGQSTTVPFVLRVPETAAPGGHYGVMFAETQPTGEQKAGSVLRKKRVGAIIYATVKGVYTLAGNLSGTSIPFLQFRSPITASSTVVNTGNTDFSDKVTYKVSDTFNRLKYQVQKDYDVLPQTTRKIPLEWPDSPWFGLYKVEVTNSFLGKTDTHSGYVLIVPRWILAVILLVIIGGVVYAVLRRRRR
jgi:hypothetical protein